MVLPQSARKRLFLAIALLPSCCTVQIPSQTVMPAASAQDHVSDRPSLPENTLSPIKTHAANRSVSSRERRAAESLYLHGARQLDGSNFADAEQDFARAAALDPDKPDYLAALVLAREHHVSSLLQQAAMQRPLDPAKADQLIDVARKLDPANPRVQQHNADVGKPPQTAPIRATQIAGTIQLHPNSSRHDVHEHEDVRALITRIAGEYGIAASFDIDIQPATVRIDADSADFAEAMRMLTLLTGTFFVPLDEHTIIFAKNTPENHQRYDRIVQETFFLPGLTSDQLKDYVSIAQNVLDIRQVSVAPLGGALVVRGAADRVAAVERIIADLQQGTSDIVVDLKLYSIDKQHVQNLGVVLPTSFSTYSVASEAQTIVSQNSALITQLIASGVIPSTASTVQLAEYLVFAAGLGGSSSLLTNSFLLFGGGLTTAAVSAGNSPTINLALTNSEARALDDVQLRVSDRQTGTFKSGTRYPIQTSLVSDIATSTAGANTTVNGVSLSSLLASYLGTNSVNSGAVIPQIQYEDLGFTLTAVPRVLRTGDVGMKLEIKVTSLAGAALNGIPVLNSRQFSSDLTVHDGETVMMISDTTQSELAAVSGLPGLGELPGFQSTTNRNSTKITSDLVLIITPHIARHSHTAAAGPYIPLVVRPGEE